MKLYAGAGCGTIHFPDALFPMEGFRGIHDAPRARVLALECGEKAALVSLELVMLPPELVDMVKTIVMKHTGTKIENIWVHTTHAITTPHSPNAPMGPGGVPIPLSEEERKNLEGKRKLYADALRTAVTEAAKAAAEVFRPALLGWGQAESHVSINRDVETPCGWWIGQNPDGATEPGFDLLRIEDERGSLIALVFTGGLKPCAIDNSQMKEGKRLVSSDVPGLACRLVEAELGVPCLFFMGAAGDQVPKEQALLEEVLPDGTVKVIDHGVEAGLEMVQRLGTILAKDVLSGLKAIRCEEAAPVLTLAETAVLWGGKGRIPMIPRKTVEFRKEREVRVDGRILLLGDTVLVGLKPEINCVTGRQMKSASPYGKTLVISMVDGGQKYMPDAKSYENITWEAQSAMLMPGGAESWVAAVAQKLKQMRGENCCE